MLAKIKPSNFIDALQVELNASQGAPLRGILRDDSGFICSTLEKKIMNEHEHFTWSGLNDLPYGRYTVELFHGDDDPESDRIRMNLVKRI